MNGTDAFAATVPGERQRMIADSPEPPLFFLFCLVSFGADVILLVL